VVSYGTTTDTPLVGDWDGNGTVTVGVWRSGRFYLRNSNTSGAANTVVGYGRSTDRPIVGDWNGDGRTDVGVRRGNTYFLATAGSFTYGRADDRPLAGDWDANGVDSIGVRRGNAYFLSNNNTNAAQSFSYGRSTDLAIASDFNGDSRSEITVVRAPIPPRPADRDCSDFGTQAEAQAWFDYYYPYCGVAGLDADNDLVACEALP
jgi:hypothetical protein